MRPQRLLLEGTSTENYCAYTTDDHIIVLNAEVLASAVIRNVGISVLNAEGLASALIRNVVIVVLNANLSGKAQRAAATDAERARVQVEMGCLYQTRGLHPSQSPSVL